MRLVATSRERRRTGKWRGELHSPSPRRWLQRRARPGSCGMEAVDRIGRGVLVGGFRKHRFHLGFQSDGIERLDDVVADAGLLRGNDVFGLWYNGIAQPKIGCQYFVYK